MRKIFNFQFLIFFLKFKGVARRKGSRQGGLNKREGALAGRNSLTGPLNHKPKGFTLVELLLYMGIFLILLVVFLQLFSSILDVQLESQSTSAVDSDGKYIIARLTYDIENASSIVTPSSNGLTRSSLEVWSNGVDEDFVLTGGNFQLVNVGTGQANNLNSADTLVSNVSFTRLGSTSGKSTITVTFTLTSTTHRTGGPETRNFTTTLGQR